MLDATQKPADSRVPLAHRNEVARWPLVVALVVGIVTALLSISLEYSAFGEGFGGFITAVLFPGLLGSMAISGNAHAFSLWIAAGINCIIYFLMVWMICGVSRRILRWFR
jgi:hypothetical protein